MVAEAMIATLEGGNNMRDNNLNESGTPRRRKKITSQYVVVNQHSKVQRKCFVGVDLMRLELKK